MKNEAQLLIEIWDYVRDYIPAKRRVEIASSILKSFENYGIEPYDLRDIQYEDDLDYEHLQKAYKELYSAEIDEEEEYFDDLDEDDRY